MSYWAFSQKYGLIIGGALILFCLAVKFGLSKILDFKQARKEKQATQIKHSTF